MIPGSAFTAITQLGTESAVIIYFRKDIWLIIKNWALALIGKLPRNDPEARLGWLVIIGSIPIVVLGLMFQDAIDHGLRNLWTTAAMLAGFGIIIGVIDRVAANARPLESMTWRNGVFLGLVQSLALIPGVSRSGATIAGGLALGYQRVAAAKYLLPTRHTGGGRLWLVQAGRHLLRSGAASLGADRVGDGDLLRHRLRGDRLAAALRQHPQLHAVRDLSNRAGRSGGHLVAHRSTEPIAPGGQRWPALTIYGATPERSNASAATVNALIFSSTELPCGASAHVVTPDAASS